MKNLDTLNAKERAVLDLFVKATVADSSGAFACYYASSQGSFTQAHQAAGGSGELNDVDRCCRGLKKGGFIDSNDRAGLHASYWATDEAIQAVNADGGPK